MNALLVALVCLSGAGAGSALLYRDFTHGDSESRGESLATLEKREARVRRKPASSYIWQHIEEASPLYLKESIQTGIDSAAIVRLKDGTLLELGENSLVVIDRTAELSLNYLKGSMILRGAEGDKQITADSTGKAQIRELNVRLLHPETLAHFFIDDSSGAEIVFQWETNADAQSLVEVSPDRGFRSARVRRFKPDNGTRVAVKGLPPGQHFWRVVAQGGEPSPSRAFRVSSAEALVPVWPVASERIRSFGERSPLQFRWRPFRGDGSDAIRHELEISSDAQFQNLVSRQAISADSGIAAISGIASGQYHWRLRSRFGELEKVSRPETFAIEHTEKVSLTLLGPAPKAALGIQPQLRFVWSGADNPDLVYHWELQDQQGAPVSHAKGHATAALWRNVRPGVYQWRVSAIWKDKTVGTSDWSPMTVSEGEPLALLGPSDSQELLFWEKEPDFNFRWKEDLLAKQGYNYEFQLATDREFSNVVASSKTRATSLPRSVIGSAEGTLYWRVRVLRASENSAQVVKSSEIRSLRYGRHPLLAAPTVKPGKKSFNLRDDDTPHVLEWAPLEAALGYEITFVPEGRQPASGEPLVKRTKATSVTVPELPEGTYTWKVQAIDPIQRRGGASPGERIEITYGTPLPAPKILTKEVQ